MKAVKRKSTIGDIIEQLDEYKSDAGSKWIATEIYNNRFHKIFMNNDATNEIRENDIIAIFEIKENFNPLAIYLEYEGTLILSFSEIDFAGDWKKILKNRFLHAIANEITGYCT